MRRPGHLEEVLFEVFQIMSEFKDGALFIIQID